MKNFYQNYKKEIHKFIVIYSLSLLVFNWSDISWIFNYKTISGMAYDFFNPYPSIDAFSMQAYFSNNQSAPLKIEKKEEIKFARAEKNNIIEIPRILLSAPIIFPKSDNLALLQKDLNSGAVYYPGSVYPEEKGDIVILGHSAPPNWPKTKYDWIFSDIEDLNIGDEIILNINNKQYRYSINKKIFIKRGEEIPVNISNDNNYSNLTIVSCWPPGKDYQRIALQAVLLLK